jgi:transcriptional regulator with XRE-family HTH domain
MRSLHFVLITLHNVHGQSSVNPEHIVPMEIFAKRLQERAKQLGISNAEAARRIGLDERRYAHYVSDRREPDLMTLKSIAEGLGTTPNWLLGITSKVEKAPETAALIDRFVNAARGMTRDQLEMCVIQAEAVVVSNH